MDNRGYGLHSAGLLVIPREDVTDDGRSAQCIRLLMVRLPGEKSFQLPFGESDPCDDDKPERCASRQGRLFTHDMVSVQPRHIGSLSTPTAIWFTRAKATRNSELGQIQRSKLFVHIVKEATVFRLRRHFRSLSDTDTDIDTEAEASWITCKYLAPSNKTIKFEGDGGKDVLVDPVSVAALKQRATSQLITEEKWRRASTRATVAD